MKVITVILIDAGRYCNTSTNLVHITETTKTEALNSKCAIFFKKHIAQIPLTWQFYRNYRYLY